MNRQTRYPVIEFMPHLPFAHLASIFGFVLGLLLVTRELRERHAPSVTFAWLLLIVLVPYLGVPLYLMIGGRKIRRRASEKTPLYAGTPAPNPMETPLDRLLSGMGVPPRSTDNLVALVPTGEGAFAAVLDLMEGAKQSIHIATFVLGGDEVGNTILDRLTERARQGIEVRVLVDGVFALRVNRRRAQALRSAGGRIAFFTPLIHIPFRGRSNLRLHRKLVIADGVRALAGGMNLAEEYMGPRPLAGRWRDVALRVEGSAVTDLEHIFHEDWAFAAGERLSVDGRKAVARGSGAPVRVVASGPDVPTDTLYDAILFSIFSAEERVWIATPYFVPDEAIVRALRLACRRGVDVRMVVPDPSNHLAADLAGAPYLRDLEEAGASVRPYRRGMLHAKMLLFDHTVAMVGSANLDMRSLFLNYEIVAVLSGKDEIDGVASWFEELVSECATEMRRTGRMRAAIEDVARLLGPLT